MSYPPLDPWGAPAPQQQQPLGAAAWPAAAAPAAAPGWPPHGAGFALPLAAPFQQQPHGYPAPGPGSFAAPCGHAAAPAAPCGAYPAGSAAPAAPPPYHQHQQYQVPHHPHHEHHQHQHHHQQQHQQHHQQQQQHQAPAAWPHGAPLVGAGGRVAVIGEQYCFPYALELVLQEGVSMGSFGGDAFHISDSQGRTYFTQAPKMFSMTDKRVLQDAPGQPCVGMAKKMLSMKPTWLVYRGGGFHAGALVANVRANFSFTPSVSVYLNDGDRESDFKIRGNYRAKRFSISQKLPGGGEREVASVHKESRFASATAFLMAAMTSADKYFLHVEPGVDAAFMVALALLVDELFHDEQK